MKHQPYFNNPRVRIQPYQGPPRNRAERRAMAKNKGRGVERLSNLERVKRQTQTLKQRQFRTEIKKFKEPGFEELQPHEYVDYEALQIAELKKRQAVEKRRETLREKKEVELFLESEEDRAEDLNNALDTATRLQSNFSLGNGKYASYLEIIVERLKELGYPVPTYDTKDLNHMYANVRFDRLPNDPDINQAIEQIMKLDFSSEENYHSMKVSSATAAFKTLVDDNNLVDYNDDLSKARMNELLLLMESSAAWEIAKRNAPDSEQIKANWVDLYTKFDEALSNGLKDVVLEILNNPDSHTVKTALDTVEEEITNALKEV